MYVHMYILNMFVDMCMDFTTDNHRVIISMMVSAMDVCVSNNLVESSHYTYYIVTHTSQGGSLLVGTSNTSP